MAAIFFWRQGHEANEVEDLRNALQEEAELRLSWDELALVRLTEKSELPPNCLGDTCGYFVMILSTLLYYIFLTLLGCCNCLWVLVIVWQIDPWNIPSFSDVATTSSGTSTQTNCSSPQCSIQDQIPPNVLIRDVGAFCIRTKFLSIHNSTSSFYWWYFIHLGTNLITLPI